MTSVAAAIPAAAIVTFAAAKIIGAVEDRIQPVAFKADADKCPPAKKSDETQHDQDKRPVHGTSHKHLDETLPGKCGLVMAMPGAVTPMERTTA